MNYLVKVDEKGLLRWARPGDLVDTAAGTWQNSGDGSGIVPYKTNVGEPNFVHRTSFQMTSEQIPGESQDEETQNATHYVDASKAKNPAKRWVRNCLTTQGWLEKLLRRTLRRNTWIYVVVRVKCTYKRCTYTKANAPTTVFTGQTLYLFFSS